MSSLVIYLIKANIALTLFYLAYRFGLRRLTFYTLNRFFLLFGIVFSAIFPLVNLDAFFQQHQQLAGSVAYYAPDWNTLQRYIQPQNQFTVWTLIAYVFWAGVIVMAIRFCMQMLSLLRVHLRTKAGFLQEEKIRFMNDRLNPFSFFKNIYINPALHSAEELQKILVHEKIHAKGWHSADVLAGEVNNIFYWFNPGAWLMKTSIQENLEFITDRKILSSGMDAKSYQYSLIKVSAIPFANPLANNFSLLHLKKRIKMMNRKRSSGFHLLRYLLLLPVIAIAAFIINSSRAQSVSSQEEMNPTTTLHFDTLKVLKKIPKNQYFNENGYAILVKMGSGETSVLNRIGVVFGPFNIYSMSAGQLKTFNGRFGSKATYEEVQAMKNHAQFLKDHPEISSYIYESPERILIWTSLRQSKIYHLNNATDRNLLLKKYGSIPPKWGRFADGRPTPQPPKIKYTPPFAYRDSIPLPYSTNALPADYINFLRRNQSVKSLEWYLVQDKGPALIHVELKNGKVESYDVNNLEEMKKAEAKYGKFPASPPPPAPTKPKSTSFNIPTNTNKKESKHLLSVILIPTSLVSPQEDTMKKDDKFYVQIAYKAAQQKHYDWAENYAQQSLKLNPNNAKAKSILRYVHQMKGYQNKMDEYNKERGNSTIPKVQVQFTPPVVVKTATDSIRIDDNYFAQLSYQKAREKDYEEATSYAQKSLQLNPNNAKAKQVLHYINQMKGYQKKMEEYERAHKNMDSAPAHAVNFNYPINYHGPLSEASSGIMALLPAPPVDRVFGSNQTLPETVIGERYYGYNLKRGSKNTMNTSLTHTIASRVNYGIKDTTKFPLKNTLYIVNDKKVNRTYIQKLNPQNISSISVLKDKAAIREYGPAAKEGVIKITTKDYIKTHKGNTNPGTKKEQSIQPIDTALNISKLMGNSKNITFVLNTYTTTKENLIKAVHKYGIEGIGAIKGRELLNHFGFKNADGALFIETKNYRGKSNVPMWPWQKITINNKVYNGSEKPLDNAAVMINQKYKGGIEVIKSIPLQDISYSQIEWKKSPSQKDTIWIHVTKNL